MFFLIVGRDRIALPIGDSSLGGSGEDALPIAELAGAPLAATLVVTVEGVATLARAGDEQVLVNGEAVGDQPRALSHGSKLDVAGIRMLVADVGAGGSTDDIPGVRDDDIAALASLGAGEPTADTGGRLVTHGGRSIPIPSGGLSIGREPSCDLVLSGKGVSRRHATIRPSLQGYMLVNSGTNATMVNGRRIAESHLLGLNDVIRVGDDEFTFVADRASFESASPMPDDVRQPASPDPRPVATPPAKALFATLEGLNEGVTKGVRFRIERPVAHIGRGQHNDVRINDKSVSSSHAALTRRSGTWVVLDLGSTNGTYVEGERITGERRLSGVTELRFGNVKLMFRPIGGGGDDDGSTRALVGVSDDPE